MAKDIEEFLKMAAKRRQQQKKAGSRPGSSPASGGQPPIQRSAAPKPVAKPAKPRTVLPASDEEIVVLDKSSAPDPYQQSVAEHVRTYIDTSDLADHASHLGETVAKADDRMDSRLHSTFDHRLGSLESTKSDSAFSTTTTTTAKQVSPIANDLLNMLSNPQTIRQAILVNEILNRPNFD